MKKIRIMIVDDESSITYTLKTILDDYEIYDFSTGISALESLQKGDRYDILIVDYRLQAISGIDILIEAKRVLKNYRGILLTAYSNKEILEQAINEKLIYKVINKPLAPEKIKEEVVNAIEDLQRVKDGLIKVNNLKKLLGKFVSQAAKGNYLIHTSNVIKKVHEDALKYANNKANVVITGENGVGKEVIANIVHSNSSRAGKAFIKVNCSAIPDALFESEMFGYEKGAFTGAENNKKGKFELAHEGTIFLDEIGELTLQNQSKILRAVENKEISPVGSTRVIKLDVRIIAATNRDLKGMVAVGEFREDLYFRLNVIHIHVPPLRERAEDIPILAIYFANTIAQNEGGISKEIESEALSILKKHKFSGNVRELKNIIYRAYLSCENSMITKQDLESIFKNEFLKTDGDDIFQNTILFNSFKEMVEARYLETQLQKHEYSLKMTAQSLGMQTSNLSSKLKGYNILVKR